MKSTTPLPSILAIRQDLFKALTPQGLALLAPDLAATSGGFISNPALPTSRREIEGRGFTRVATLLPPSAQTKIAEAIERLVASGLPPLFVYAFEELWRVADALQTTTSALMGARYVVIEDFWAFRVPPGKTGWAPHRGVNVMLDRHAPEYLNAWIAISDVEVDRACMHFVSLDDDPGYVARDLAKLDTSRGVAAPVSAGDLLLWNANTLHWGGASSELAAGPRCSITFTLCREDALTRSDLGARPSTSAGLIADPWARLDAIARQIGVYGSDDAMSAELRAWASSTVAMGAMVRSPT